MSPPRDPNQPDEQACWPQVDHSLNQGHPNVCFEPGFARPGAGIAPVRPKGWDDWEDLIHADHTSSPTAWMHQDSPIHSQQPSGSDHPYRTDNPDGSLRNPGTAGQEGKGRHPMVETVLIAAAGIFVIGIVTGIVVLVSVGVRREEQRFREERRFLEEHGIWGSPGAPDHYLLEQAPDGVS